MGRLCGVNRLLEMFRGSGEADPSCVFGEICYSDLLDSVTVYAWASNAWTTQHTRICLPPIPSMSPNQSAIKDITPCTMQNQPAKTGPTRSPHWARMCSSSFGWHFDQSLLSKPPLLPLRPRTISLRQQKAAALLNHNHNPKEFPRWEGWYHASAIPCLQSLIQELIVSSSCPLLLRRIRRLGQGWEIPELMEMGSTCMSDRDQSQVEKRKKKR